MKATLTKNIKVKTATVYLVFEKEQQRPDIVNFLNGLEFDNEIINNRVREYLTKLHLLDKEGMLTKKGEKVIETGKLFVREEGKYKIWFTNNDNFIGTKILYFKRIAPQQDNTIKKLNIYFDKENYFLPVDNDEFSYLKLIQNDISGDINGKNENISLSWVWDNLESSYFVFIGKINKKTIKPHPIECGMDLKKYILNIFPDWNTKWHKLKIRFNSLQNNSEKQSFIINSQKPNYASFDNIEFTEIPIMPFDKQDAVKWRNWLVEKEVEKSYFLKYDFEKLVKDINEKEGFSAYRNSLNIPDITEFRKTVYSKDRSKQSPTFWHLSAPDDLNPDIEQTYSEKTIDLEIGKQISLKQIAMQLKNNINHKINAVFYYDKYTYTRYQQKNMIAFFNAFDNIEKKYLITNTKSSNKGKRADYIKNSNSNIKEIDVTNVFDKKNKQQHNRYVILAESKEKYTVWQLPSSIDYIKFNDNEVTPDTIGEINDSISFNRVPKTMLKPELKNFIENKL